MTRMGKNERRIEEEREEHILGSQGGGNGERKERGRAGAPLSQAKVGLYNRITKAGLGVHKYERKRP